MEHSRSPTASLTVPFTAAVHSPSPCVQHRVFTTVMCAPSPCVHHCAFTIAMCSPSPCLHHCALTTTMHSAVAMPSPPSSLSPLFLQEMAT